MPTASTLLLFTGAALLLAAMPGPGLFYIAGRTIASGRADGFASCVGSALGGLVHVIAGAVGISALIMASTTAFSALKVLGGLYLIYLGVQTWRFAEAPILKEGPTTRADSWRALRQGIIAVQFSVLGLISIALNTGMALLVVSAAATLRGRVTARPNLLLRLRQGSGAVLGSLGISLLLTRRPA